MGRQYYILPNKKEVKVSGARWQTDARRGRGAIDLVMHLQGYTQMHMEKALAQLAHAFGEEKVVGEVGRNAMLEAGHVVKDAIREFAPKEKAQEKIQRKGMSR